MSGKIFPYYCPRRRDDIFQRTLFIATGCAAITSTNVEQKVKESLNIFVKDKKAVAALEKEYDNYMKICKPLMEVAVFDYPSNYQKYYKKAFEYGGDIYYRGANPTIYTMPKKLAEKINRKYPDT